MSLRLFDLVGCLSAAMDLVSPEVVGHHKRVALVAARLAETAGLPERDRTDLVLAGLLHDAGAFSLDDRLAALEFDASDRAHARTGERLLKGFAPFKRAAAIIGQHHTPWVKAAALEASGDTAGLGNLLCLADRVDVLLPRAAGQAPDRTALMARIRGGAGRMFHPEGVRLLEMLAARPEFWEEILTHDLPEPSDAVPGEGNPAVDAASLARLARIFSQIIDFRCRFTATHSRGVAATAVEVGRRAGMAASDLPLLGVAGELHDLGKLGIPCSIIEKPASLSPPEMDVMRRHAEYGARVLSVVPGLDRVAAWAGNHHERLSGKGYPRRLAAKDLDLGSRVMAVSDVFTALAEDRPYRAGLPLNKAVDILASLVQGGHLDGDVLAALKSDLEAVNATRSAAQAQALRDFEAFASLQPRDAAA